MVGYVVLGISALLSIFGLGLLSMGALLIAWLILAGPMMADPDTLKQRHGLWLKRTAIYALIAHSVVTVFLVTEMAVAIQSGEAHGIIGAFFAHYILDHASEFVIGAWIGFRTLKGGLNFSDAKCPVGQKMPALAE